MELFVLSGRRQRTKSHAEGVNWFQSPASSAYNERDTRFQTWENSHETMHGCNLPRDVRGRHHRRLGSVSSRAGPRYTGQILRRIRPGYD